MANLEAMRDRYQPLLAYTSTPVTVALDPATVLALIDCAEALMVMPYRCGCRRERRGEEVVVTMRCVACEALARLEAAP